MSWSVGKCGTRKMRYAVIAAIALAFCTLAVALPQVVQGATLVGAAEGAAANVDYDHEQDRDVLPGEEWWLNDYGHAWVSDPETGEGEDRIYQVKKIEVVSGGELLENFWEERDEDGHWWCFRARDFGTTTFKVTYEKLDGTEDSYTFNVNTRRATSDLDLWVDSESGSTMVFPGESIALSARAVFHQYDAEDSFDGFTYTWKLTRGEDLATISSATNADGSSSATVTFKDAEPPFEDWAIVEVTATREDTSVTREVWLDVATEYPEIWFAESDSCTIDPYGLMVGDSVKVTPEVRYFTQGVDGYTTCDLRSICWYFDENCITITAADGSAVHDGEEVAPGSFTLTRTGDWNTDFNVQANWYDPKWGDEGGMREENCHLWIADCHTDVWFEDVPEFVFVKDASTTATLTLESNNLPKAATIEWTVGLFDWDEWVEGGIFAEGTDYTVSGQTITLNGAQIMRHLDSEGAEEHRLHVRVLAEVKSSAASGEALVLSEDDAWVDFFEPAVEYEREEDCKVLIGQGHDVSGNARVRVWDEDNPYGDDRNYRVTDLQVVSGADVVEVNGGSDDEGNHWWWIEANGLGTATLKVTYETLEGGTDSYTFQMSVVGETYSFELNDEKPNVVDDCLLPGETGEVWLQGWRHKAVKKTGAHGGTYYEYEDSTDGLTYKWRLEDGEEFATMTNDPNDPTHVTIAMKEMPAGVEYLHGEVLASCELYADGKKVAQSGWFYEVASDFYTVQPTGLQDAELFCTTTVDPHVVHRYLDAEGKPASDELPADQVSVYWSYDEGDSLVTNANGAQVVNSEWGDNDTPAGPGPFTITRQREWGTWYDVMFRWSEGGDEREYEAHYQLSDKDYEIGFDKYAYDVDEGSTATLTLDVSGVSGIPGYEQAISIWVGTGWDQETEQYEHLVAADAYTVTKTKDAWTISMPYETVKQVIDEFGGVGVGVHAVIEFEDGALYRNAFAEVELATAPFFLDADPADEKNHGAEVDWMGRAGISTGWVVEGGRVFKGMENVKRCDFAAFLYRLGDLADDGERNESIALTDKQVEETLATVSDCTPEKTSHAMEVAWMIREKISTGWPDKGKKTVSFRPMADVARQDMAAFLYRFADMQDDGEQNQSLKKGTEKVTFSDVRHGDETNHATEVEWLASIGVTKGWEMKDGTFQFRGKNTVKRQDMAAFMYRLAMYMYA